MKTKIIKKVIETKIDSWIDAIGKEISSNAKKRETFGENFHKKIKDHIIVTGGCITSMLLNEEPNDFDIYFDSTEICENVIKFYNFESKKTVLGVDFFVDYFKKENKKGDKVTVLSATSNALTLSNDIQLITRFVGSPEEVHKNFDFVHTKNYWYKNNLVLNPDSIESILTKELKYVGSLFPVSSIFRMKKFIARGWTITAGEMLKIAWDVSKLDLGDIDILRDQLVGVDISYFSAVIDKLNESKYNEIDRTYLFEVIDEIFNS